MLQVCNIVVLLLTSAMHFGGRLCPA